MCVWGGGGGGGPDPQDPPSPGSAPDFKCRWLYSLSSPLHAVCKGIWR